MNRASTSSSTAGPDRAIALEAVDLEKSFATAQESRRVLGGVSLQLAAGHITAALGPNAIGKSTLVRILAGIESASAGEIHRRPIAGGRPFLALQLQEVDETLLPWRSNLRNATLGFETRGVEIPVAIAAVSDLISRYGLPVPLRKTPATSSGGERQMVAVTRAVVLRPQVLLLDEPFSRIDPALVTRWWRFLKRFVREAEIACLVVTHNVVEAAALADDVIVLTEPEPGGGAVVRTRLAAPPESADGFGVANADLVQSISAALERAYGA